MQRTIAATKPEFSKELTVYLLNSKSIES